MATDNEAAQPNRRKHRRFLIELELRYRLASGKSGTGESVNMSSGGLLFSCEDPLPPGELIEADLTWPFLIENGQALELRVHGMILRSSVAGIAVSISKYQFRAEGQSDD